MMKNTLRMIVVGVAAVFVYGSTVFAAPAAGTKGMEGTENALAATAPEEVAADNAIDNAAPKGFAPENKRDCVPNFSGKDRKVPHAKAPDVHNFKRDAGRADKGERAPKVHARDVPSNMGHGAPAPRTGRNDARPDVRDGKHTERMNHDGTIHRSAPENRSHGDEKPDARRGMRGNVSHGRTARGDVHSTSPDKRYPKTGHGSDRANVVSDNATEAVAE